MSCKARLVDYPKDNVRPRFDSSMARLGGIRILMASDVISDGRADVIV
jgi:hypothetical protein